jgi:hypothetical protein
MTYFLDSNFLIDAKNLHFPMDRKPEFWSWLVQLGNDGILGIPEAVHKEVTRGNDDLVEWVNRHQMIFYAKQKDASQLCHIHLPGMEILQK